MRQKQNIIYFQNIFYLIKFSKFVLKLLKTCNNTKKQAVRSNFQKFEFLLTKKKSDRFVIILMYSLGYGKLSD